MVSMVVVLHWQMLRTQACKFIFGEVKRASGSNSVAGSSRFSLSRFSALFSAYSVSLSVSLSLAKLQTLHKLMTHKEKMVRLRTMKMGRVNGGCESREKMWLNQMWPKHGRKSHVGIYLMVRAMKGRRSDRMMYSTWSEAMTAQRQT